MAALEHISLPELAALRIVFMHGLGGSARDTFQYSAKASWIDEIGREFPQAHVAAFSYNNRPTGAGFDFEECASSIVPFVRELSALPTVIVAHSMGGLIAKSLFVQCSQSVDPSLRSWALSVRAMLFLATPHQGSPWASVLSWFLPPTILSEATLCLRADSGQLNALHQSFLHHTGGRVRLSSMYEGVGVYCGLVPFRIVDRARASANGITEAIATPHDHISIAKPSHSADVVATHARWLIASSFDVP